MPRRRLVLAPPADPPTQTGGDAATRLHELARDPRVNAELIEVMIDIVKRRRREREERGKLEPKSNPSCHRGGV
jgi:hypothetical protein